MSFAKAPRLMGTWSFKIFSDNQKTDPSCTVGTSQKTRIPLRRESVTIDSVATSNTSNMKKGNLKITGKGKISDGNSVEYTKVTRKALADLSNLGGNTQRIPTVCGSSTIGTSQKTQTRIPLRRKSVTIDSVATSNTNNMKKGNLEITGKGKISDGNSVEYTKVTRKALADLSNLGGNTQRIPTLCGSSTMKCKDVKCGNLQRTSVGSTRVNDVSVKKSTKEHERKKTTELGSNNNYKTGQKFIVSATNISKKAIAQLSSARTYTWKTRTSVGSIPSDRNSQSKNNVPIVRKSVKIQTTVKTSLQNRSSLKKPPVGRSKSRSISSIPSTEEVAKTLSLPEKVETECLREDFQGESSSSENKDPTTKVLDVTAKPNRKSFTSLLVNGSKFDEKNGETAQTEKLPTIDDESNQLEVAEYVDDIYQFYWATEALNPALGYYLSAPSEASPVTRGILINWLIEVHFKFHLRHETLYLTVNLLDNYLSQVPIRKNEMQLIGLTALLLASKYEDCWPPQIKDLIRVSAESCTREHILGMERIMLNQLKFRLNAPTPYVFMLRFVKAAQSNKKLEQLAFYLIELCLVEYEALKYKPSLLCASAIYVARCTLHMTPVWTSLLNNHTHYNVSQMKDSSDMILRFHKAAKTGKLRVTYEKYMNPDHSNVAGLKPLDELPL